MSLNMVTKNENATRTDLRGIAEDLYCELTKEGLERNQILAVTGHMIEMVTQTIRYTESVAQPESTQNRH